MKKQYKNQFNFRVNENEAKIIEQLRERHAVNLSMAFKIFLKDLFTKLEPK